jgi:hypothetical protein
LLEFFKTTHENPPVPVSDSTKMGRKLLEEISSELSMMLEESDTLSD